MKYILKDRLEPTAYYAGLQGNRLIYTQHQRGAAEFNNRFIARVMAIFLKARVEPSLDRIGCQ
jgi:hypothetical protein